MRPEVIKAARHLIGKSRGMVHLTRPELAKLMGWTTRAVSRWETPVTASDHREMGSEAEEVFRRIMADHGVTEQDAEREARRHRQFR